MTQKEILEYNKRCAEFLGLVALDKPYKGAFTTNNGKNIPDSFLQLVYSEMEGESWYIYPKFHSDWNWIIEVVNKIESSGYSITMDQYKKIHRVYLNCDKTMEEVCNGSTGLDRKTVLCEAINQFLIWYNENSNTNR